MWLKALFFVLFACGAFMVWDVRRRNRAHAAARARRLPQARGRIQFGPPLFALAMMFVLLALVELVHPRMPPFEGPLGHWLQRVHDTLGVYGIAMVWGGLAALGGAIAWLAWQRDQALASADRAALRES